MGPIGLLLVGIGAYLMYDAVKSPTPAPVTNAKSALTRVSSSSTGSSTTDTNTLDQAA
jgi:hypothetical protein